MKKSQCCAADAKAVVGGEGTGYYACAKCGKEFREAKKKMTNYEKICEAWRIGWAAVVQLKNSVTKPRVIIGAVDNSFIMRSYSGNKILAVDLSKIEEFKIIGYRYAGELAGNEEPREGQKFRSKSTEDVYIFDNGDLRRMDNLSLRVNFYRIDKHYWLPYFD